MNYRLNSIPRLISRSLILQLLMVSLFVGRTTQVQAASNLRYVAPGGNCGGATPCYASLQTAVDAAAPGDEIRVAAATYNGVNTQGGLLQMVYISKSLTIKGGYTTSNWTTPNPNTNATDLQAQTLGRVIYISGASTSVNLYGLHLTYGNSTGLGGHKPTNIQNYDAGGGLYASGADVTLDHCWLTDNASPSGGYGGGVYISNGILKILNTSIDDNEAGYGGGGFYYNSDATIQSSSEFNRNKVTASNPGGVAFYAYFGSLVFKDGVAADNEVTFGGISGAIYIYKAQFLIDNIEIRGSKNSNGFSSFAADGTLKNSEIHDNDGTAINIDNNTVVISGNEIYNNKKGISIDAISSMDITISDNNIHNNQMSDHLSSSSGAGIYMDVQTGSATVKNNIFRNTTAGLAGVNPSWGNGGGVFIFGDNARLEGNQIQDNSAVGLLGGGSYQWGGHGGGLYIMGGPILINNNITGNAAIYKGSGINIIGGAAKLYNNTISANSAGSGNDETGVYVEEKSVSEKSQVVLWNSIITNQETGIYVKGDVTNNVVNVDGILWYGNTHNTAGSGTFFLAHEHSGDPLFVNPALNNFHIKNGSAAINQGLNSNIPTDLTTDIDNKPRIANGLVDLGSDEYDGLYLLQVTKSGNGNGIVTSSPNGIRCGADCAQSFTKNTIVTLDAKSNSGSVFVRWSGHADCTDGKVSMNSDKTCTARFVKKVSNTFSSQGSLDGWVLESGENSNKGGTFNSTANNFLLGDDNLDRQYRAILSFNTGSLPDNAVVTRVTLKIKKQGLTGTNPFTILGGLKVDIRKPFFGMEAELASADFQAAAEKISAGTFNRIPINNWYTGILSSSGNSGINLRGTTQFRLRFEKDDNDDLGADLLKFYSGNFTTIANQPKLIIEYFIP